MKGGDQCSMGTVCENTLILKIIVVLLILNWQGATLNQSAIIIISPAK